MADAPSSGGSADLGSSAKSAVSATEDLISMLSERLDGMATAVQS